MSARAFGRSLADFGDLLPAERELLECCKVGRGCVVGRNRPEEEKYSNIVRAGFLRFLILGGDDENPVHEQGVQLQGAWITGALEMSGATSRGDVFFVNNRFEAALNFTGAIIKGTLHLNGSYVPGLSGDRLQTDGSVFLRRGFTAEGEVRLLGAKIGGNLECVNGHFEAGSSGMALNADGVQVVGSVFLRDGFTAEGEVRLLGAKIGGDLICTNGKFEAGLSGAALSADRVQVSGSVFLRNGFEASGNISFHSAEVGGVLDFRNSKIEILNFFTLDNANVKGTLFLRGCQKKINNMSLSGAHVGVLEDDKDSWGDGLNLHHFTYDKISDASPMTADMRIAWLEKQQNKFLGEKRGSVLAPQPWLRLKKVLKEAGYYEEARQVGVELEKRKSSYNRRNTWLFRWVCSLCCCGEETKSSSKATPLFLWCLNWLYGRLTGFGYRPINLVCISFFVWLLCFGFYALTAYKGEFAPSDMKVVCGYYDHCAPGAVEAASVKAKPDWLNGNILPPEYTDFESGMYSLNVLVPVLDLQQESAWSPYVAPNSWLMKSWGGWAQIFVWVETCYGWLAGAMLLTVLSGLTRKQEEE